MSFLDELRIIIEKLIISTGMTVPPNSSIFFIFVSIGLSLFSGFLYWLILDTDELNRINKSLKEHSIMENRAIKERDPKLWIRVKRNDERMMELQQKSSMMSMLPMLITYAPIIYVFTTLREVFQQPANIALNGNADCVLNSTSCGGVVVLPFHMDSWVPLIGKWFSPWAGDPTLSIAGFGVWYFLSAIVVSSFFTRVLGINLSFRNGMR